MLVTTKKLINELSKLYTLVNMLRTDVTKVQKAIRRLNGWNDDFHKTIEITDTETRVFRK